MNARPMRSDLTSRCTPRGRPLRSLGNLRRRARPTPRVTATVRRQYQKWHKARGVPLRCDHPECTFHVDPLAWNGRPLKLVLDHVVGNCRDNRPEKLRFLCPNCDSHLATRGGGNRGRVTAGEDRFAIKRADGATDHALFLSDAFGLDDELRARPLKGGRARRRGPTTG